MHFNPSGGVGIGSKGLWIYVDRRFFTDAVEQMLAPAYSTDQNTSEEDAPMVAENG